MKKCPKCSLIHDDSVMKCTYCGHDFTEVAEEAATEVINVEETTTPTPDEAPVEPAPEVPAQPVYNQYTNGSESQTPPPPYNQQGYNPYGAPQGKYCPRCGNLCDPNAVICVKCGMSFGPMPQQNTDDTPSALLKVACFFVPIVALILYLVEKDKKPISAKAYGKWGIIGFVIFNVGLPIISAIFTTIIGLFNVGNSYIYGFEDYGDYYFQIFANLLSIIK